jgi:hypothetical protein
MPLHLSRKLFVSLLLLVFVLLFLPMQTNPKAQQSGQWMLCLSPI